jgi:hypothetical protein
VGVFMDMLFAINGYLETSLILSLEVRLEGSGCPQTTGINEA